MTYFKFLLATALLLGFAACSPTPPPWHVVLISLDTTRADHLSCIAGPDSRAQTPALDLLASEGVLFLQAQTAAVTTLSAHSSLMTGTWPHSHGVVRNGFELNPVNQTLAETLGACGYRTRAVLGSFALDSRFGFDQGFEVFDETFDLLVGAGGADQNQRLAEHVTRAALSRVREHDQDEPLFLFAHYFDPHAPYDPPLALREAWAQQIGAAVGDPLTVERAVKAGQKLVLGPDVPAPGLAGTIRGGLSRELVEQHPGTSAVLDSQLAALYAAEVEALDAALGVLFEGLREEGLWERTIVVLTADHGETFSEHADRWNHGLWVHDTTTHVPLMIRLPAAHPQAERFRGQRISTVVSTVDVYPTLLGVLDIEVGSRVQGVDLGPLLRGEDFDRGAVFSEATQPWMGLEEAAHERGHWANSLKPHSVRKGRWKYIRAPYLKLEQLFDMEADPGEQNNLFQDPALAEILADLRGELGAYQELENPLPSEFNSTQLEETRVRLEAMGYGGGAREGPR
ncbi:MAG TPA: hypothetical protein EYQ25_13310 [Planctomycetes bacterium]|nr:hypothetical protein [Planctomycetota bacterium]HIL38605.1 hypothetical protein [Planctomycetota bacterium]